MQQPTPAVDTEIEVTDERDYVFISYSQEDKQWLESLQTMIKPLEKSLAVSFWDDTQLKPGVLRKEVIESILAKAKVAVLLVSKHFLASNFTAEYQLPQLLKGAKEEGLRIIWIYVSTCFYDETEIKNYQPAHDINQPLDELSARSPAELNKALYLIGKQIKMAVATQRHKQKIKSSLKQPSQRDKQKELGITFPELKTILIKHNLERQTSKFYQTLAEANYSGVFAFTTAGKSIILENYIIPRMKEGIEDMVLGKGENICKLHDPPNWLNRYTMKEIENNLKNQLSGLVDSDIKFIFFIIWIAPEVRQRESQKIASSFWQSDFLQSVKKRFHDENRCLVFIWAKEGTSPLRKIQGFKALTMPKTVPNYFRERIEKHLAKITEDQEFITKFCQSLKSQGGDFFSTYYLIHLLIFGQWHPSMSDFHSNPNEEINSRRYA